MPAALGRSQQVFLREAVVLFGFLNGVWVAVGVNPGANLLDAAAAILRALLGEGGPVELLLVLLPVLLTIGALVFILRRGGLLGLVAVLVAFVAGTRIEAAPTSSLLLLLAAFGLGYVATR